MKRICLIPTIIFWITGTLSSREPSDSLVLFSDLKYHSEFERLAFSNFLHQNKDTFNLFLAIDEKIGSDDARRYYQRFYEVFDEFQQKKLDSKKMNKRIKLAYSIVHDRFMKKYNSSEYFPAMFDAGTYNCVSASMVYSLAFDRLKIPYKVMASSDHVYLVANPGANSIVIETTNPGFEKTIFTGEFKQQFANYLRNSKLISEDEYRNKSVEEIFEEKFKEVREAQFNNLAGFQYYNRSIEKMLNNEYRESYELCQKAYLLYPDPQVKTLLYTTLLYIIEKCKFDNVSDIDYIAQLSRFEDSELNVVSGIFRNILHYHLQYLDKEPYCDSLYQRLTSQIYDNSMLEEISFTYYMLMSYHFQHSDKVEPYIINALRIRGNFQDANLIFMSFLYRKLNKINDPFAMLDTIARLEKIYSFERIQDVLNENKMIAYLQISEDSYRQSKINTGNKYLGLFEQGCLLPVENPFLVKKIETTYRTIAIYYFYRNNKPKAKSIVDRGLKYVPESRFLKSAVY